jgi:NAD(P)-dependent dehydrogenase (short-subunit alcohol dehydrogenase family)
MQKFVGKVALITGGSSGIGRATALAFAREGAKTVIASRGIERGEETVCLIRQTGGEALFVKTDVTSSAQVEALINKVVETYGHLDIAFNNVGSEGQIKPMIHQTEDNFNFVIETNLKGLWLSMKYEILQMLQQGCGAIVNNSSTAGLVGIPCASIYVASKHAVMGLTKSAALENAQSGIRINTVSPGTIETNQMKRLLEESNDDIKAEFQRKIESVNPVGRLGKMEEVAEAVLWLCSDAASFVTGQTLTVDGGYTVR